MNYPLVLIGIILILTIIYSLFQLYFYIKLQKKLKQPFPEKDKKYLQKIPFYKKLSQNDKKKIEKSIILFISTKNFIGIGIEVTDEMKIIISFYACLLLLHKNIGCYDNLSTILIYPKAVLLKEISNNGGVYTKEQFLIDGQSSNDVVIIAWHDAKKEAYQIKHNNVILHEFTHEIDFMSGVINGIPPLEHSKYNEWCHILFDEYRKLNKVVLKNRDWGKYKIIGEYAATNEAEFFAVITERFFEDSKNFKKHFPNLYQELKNFYTIDPIKLTE